MKNKNKFQMYFEDMPGLKSSFPYVFPLPTDDKKNEVKSLFLCENTAIPIRVFENDTPIEAFKKLKVHLTSFNKDFKVWTKEVKIPLATNTDMKYYHESLSMIVFLLEKSSCIDYKQI